MEPITGNAALGAGASLLGMVAGGIQTGNQHNRQRELMELQLKNQMKLNQQGSDLAYENWLKTSYAGQRAQMEKAGLNVGLMYGQGGQSGTLSSGSGGSAAGAQAAAPNNQMAMMLSDMAANIELKKAQANNLNADTENKQGVERNLKQTEIDKNTIENNFNTLNFNTALEQNKADLENTIANTNKQVQEGKISEIDALTRNWKNVEEILNITANTNKANEEVKQQWARVNQGWKELSQEAERIKQADRSLDQKDKEIAIKNLEQKAITFKTETERNYPSIWNVVGKSVNDVFKGIRGGVGYKKEGNVETKVE